jgi:hypothetical protein
LREARIRLDSRAKRASESVGETVSKFSGRSVDMGSSPKATTLIIVQGKLLELVEKVETLEILGVRDFLLQTDSPIETLSLLWDDIDWEMNRMSIPEPKVE